VYFLSNLINIANGRLRNRALNNRSSEKAKIMKNIINGYTFAIKHEKLLLRIFLTWLLRRLARKTEEIMQILLLCVQLAGSLFTSFQRAQCCTSFVKTLIHLRKTNAVGRTL
jgi:hypothetical protein